MYRATPSMMTIVGQLLVDLICREREVVAFDVGLDRDQDDKRSPLVVCSPLHLQAWIRSPRGSAPLSAIEESHNDHSHVSRDRFKPLSSRRSTESPGFGILSA